MISIHAPLAGSDQGRGVYARCLRISIHAPLAGSDRLICKRYISYSNFNPRSPRGERRQRSALCRDHGYFNPRSPRGERRHYLRYHHSDKYFNPRSPRGERRLRRWIMAIWQAFQSTLPSRGATASLPSRPDNMPNFNPRSPRGERQKDH